MKNHEPERSKREKNTVTVRTVFIFAACVAAVLIIGQIDPIKAAVSWVVDFTMPVILGVVLAYIMNPLAVIFERAILRMLKKAKPSFASSVSRYGSIFLSLLVLLAIIVLLMFLIVPECVDSLYKLIDNAPALIDNAVKTVNGFKDSENIILQNVAQYFDSLFAQLLTWVSSGLGTALSGVIEGVFEVVSFLFDFLIALVIFVYALLEKKKFIAQIKKILFSVFSPEKANDILDIARYGNDAFGKFVTGKLITSTIVGMLTFLFMTIMGMPYALLSAGIIAITNVIPFFGPFIGGIPTAFIVLVTDFRQGLIYVVFMLVLQQVEGNIVEPLIMEDQTGVSKFWVTAAVIFFGGVFGVGGMIFSVPLIAVLFYIIKVYVERSLTKKDLPLSSDEYLGVGGIDPETNKFYPIPEKPPRKKPFQKLKDKKKNNKKD